MYIILNEGNGATPTIGALVEAHYIAPGIVHVPFAECVTSATQSTYVQNTRDHLTCIFTFSLQHLSSTTTS